VKTCSLWRRRPAFSDLWIMSYAPSVFRARNPNGVADAERMKRTRHRVCAENFGPMQKLNNRQAVASRWGLDFFSRGSGSQLGEMRVVAAVNPPYGGRAAHVVCADLA
jgi:hypothetical protein